MAESIKFNDNKFVDATDVWDSTVNKTQRELNGVTEHIKILTIVSGHTETYHTKPQRPSLIWVRYSNSEGGFIASTSTEGERVHTLVGTIPSNIQISGSGGVVSITNNVGWNIYPIVFL